MSGISTKPYLIRAIHEWCTDSGYRPHIAVVVDADTIVPREFVRNGEIVLNVSAAATNRLRITNELIEFEARFGGVARSVSIPIDNVSAIYAQETGHGMAFEVPKALALVPEPAGDAEGGMEARSRVADADAAGAGAERDAADADATRSRRRPKLAAVPSGAEPAAAEPAAGTPSEAGAQAPAATKAPRRRRKDVAPADEGRAGKTGPAPLAPLASPSEASPSEASPSESLPSAAGPAGSAGESTPPGDGPDGKPPAGRPRLTRVK